MFVIDSHPLPSDNQKAPFIFWVFILFPFCFYNLCLFVVFLVPFFFLLLILPLHLLVFPHRMLQPVPKQEGRTVVVVNSPRTLLGPVPVRPPPGPEPSAQPTPCPTPPLLPAPVMVSTSPTGSPLIPASRPPAPVLLPPLQPNSGPLPQGELQESQSVGLGALQVDWSEE